MHNTAVSIHSKFPNVGTTIFTKMSSLAAQNNAVNLSQGFPDFTCSPELVSLLNKHMEMGHNQYAPLGGIVELREAIAEKVEFTYGTAYNPDTEVTVTAGATQAIFTAITSIIREDDEVIVFTPAYDCYKPAIELAGGEPIFVKLKGDDFTIDWEEVKKKINRRTRMIIINTPHNPTGSVLSEKDLKTLEHLVDGTDIIILSDEVYEHIIFDGLRHESAARYPKLVERSFIVSSFGKTYHTTGWKIGYCLAPKALMQEFRKVHQYLVFSVFTPAQYAYAEFLKNRDAYLELPAFYQAKRDLFRSAVEGSKFKLLPTKGTYFQLLDYTELSDKLDTDYANYLTIDHKVAGIPTSVFYYRDVQTKHLRFCFAKDDDTIKKACDILSSL